MSPGRDVEGTGPVPADGRVLAVDIGDVRVGLAASDPTQTIASPDETLPVQAPEDLDRVAEQITAAAADHEAVAVVVGYPRTLDGREGRAARRARQLAERLAEDGELAVVLWDERFTTVEAERVMLEQDASRRERKQASDRVAASLILQGWLEARRREAR